MATPDGAASAPSIDADPAFALIRAERVADVKHRWATEAQAAAESRFGRASEGARLALSEDRPHTDKELSEYILAHEVSFDWLIHGDLKGPAEDDAGAAHECPHA